MEGYQSCHWEARWDDSGELGQDSDRSSSDQCVHVHKFDESHLLRQDCQGERDERGHLEARMIPLMVDNELASREDDPRNQPVGTVEEFDLRSLLQMPLDWQTECSDSSRTVEGKRNLDG